MLIIHILTIIYLKVFIQYVKKKSVAADIPFVVRYAIKYSIEVYYMINKIN